MQTEIKKRDWVELNTTLYNREKLCNILNEYCIDKNKDFSDSHKKDIIDNLYREKHNPYAKFKDLVYFLSSYWNGKGLLGVNNDIDKELFKVMNKDYIIHNWYIDTANAERHKYNIPVMNNIDAVQKNIIDLDIFEVQKNEDNTTINES